MERRSANRQLLRAGLTLLLLGLITGLLVPLFRNPRMGLSAHLEGVLNGLLLAVLGVAWRHLHLSVNQGRILTVLALYAAYANWGATALAAIWGTVGLTPMAGAGFGGAPWQELVSKLLAISQQYGGVRTRSELDSNVVKIVDPFNNKEAFRVPTNTPLGVYMAKNPTLFVHTRIGAAGEPYHYLEAPLDTIENAKKSLIEQLQPHTSQLLGSPALTMKFIPLNSKHTYGTDMNKIAGQNMADVMSAPVNACIHGNIWVATQ